MEAKGHFLNLRKHKNRNDKYQQNTCSRTIHFNKFAIEVPSDLEMSTIYLFCDIYCRVVLFLLIDNCVRPPLNKLFLMGCRKIKKSQKPMITKFCLLILILHLHHNANMHCGVNVETLCCCCNVAVI